MKKTNKILVQALSTISTTAILGAGKVMAANSIQEGAEAARVEGMPTELVGVDGVLTKLSNTVLMIVGAIAVVMLIYGGFRYILSGGDSKKVTDAKNTILYAIIGLIICILSYAIVNFVINAVGSLGA